MVSKILKKSPTKSITKRRGRPKTTPTPVKPVAPSPTPTTLAAAIHDSLSTCRRRLAKLFAKLACIATPTSKPRHRRATPKTKTKTKTKKRSPSSALRKGLRLLKIPDFSKQGDKAQTISCDKEEVQALIRPGNLPLATPPESRRFTVRRPLYFGLPPLQDTKKGTIFLDLDETLIHSSPDPPPQRFDFVVRPVIDGDSMNFYVLKRPGVHDLLSFLSQMFEIAVFTAGLEEYASLVLDVLDTDRVISYRFYRDSCKQMDGRFVKDLSEMGRDLKRVVIVDDNPGSYLFQPDNAIQIKPFLDDPEDRECWRLMEFFHGCQCFDDFREAIRVFAPLGWHNLDRCSFWFTVDL